MSKKTLEKIIQSDNDYIVKVKNNQKKLKTTMEQIHKPCVCLDNFTTNEINKGRKEIRIIKTYRVNKEIKNNWCGAKTIVYVKRKHTRKEKQTTTDSYYLSSLSATAKEFAKGIRHHWGIENRLHYVKDVTLKEDESKIKKGNAPGILSLVRNLIIGIARINGENKIKKFMRLCAGNIVLIVSLLE